MKDNFKEWAKAAGIRAIKTFAQTAAALIGADQISVVNIDWVTVMGVSATAALLSILTSVAGLPEVNNGEV